jgi:hypothetical protein
MRELCDIIFNKVISVVANAVFFLWTMALFWRSGAVDLFANTMSFVYLTLFNIKNNALRGV